MSAKLIEALRLNREAHDALAVVMTEDERVERACLVAETLDRMGFDPDTTSGTDMLIAYQIATKYEDES